MPDDGRRSVGVRVRPNSHDFVRQLRQDLASKRYTYYVNVKANTTQATKDVRNWANTDLKKIHASIPVQANTGPASRDMADWRRRQSAIKTTVNVHADTSAAVREMEALRTMARDVTIKVKADTSRAGNVSTVVREAVKKSNVDKEFAEGLKRGIEKAKALEFDIPVNADTKKAKATTEEFRRAQAAKEIKTQLDIDTKAARLKLLELRLQEKARDINLKVDVNTSKFEAFLKRMNKVEKSFGSFTVIRSLDFGPFNLGKPSGLIGTLTTITALAGAIPGAVTGIAALSDALVRMAGAAAIVPGAIGGILASVATLAVGTQGVGDTIGAMFDMWSEGASQQEKASTKVIHAQNNYRDAIADEAKAQRNVATARREALSDLRSLNNELRGGVLNEAQALLDLQKARDRYAQGGFENETDRIQGLLDIKKAQQNVINTREDNLNLQQKANDAQTKGVEGSDKVTDALQAQAQATERVSEALESLNAGGSGATTATQKFNDALAQLSPNARDFVETIAGLKGPMKEFRDTIQDALFQGAGPAFAQMFDNLLPVIQPGMVKIAEGMNHVMMEAFDTLQTPDGKSIIERILGGTADAQESISKLINPLVRGVGTLVAAGSEHLPQVVDLFNQLLTRFATFIEEADRNGTLDKFMDDGVEALKNFAEIGINVVKIVNDFSTAFRSAFGTDILTKIAEITGKWHEFLQSAEGQKKLNDYINKAKEIWEQWKPVLDKLPGLFDALSDAASKVLDYMLPILEKILGIIEKYPGIVEAFAAVWLTAKMAGAITKIVELTKTFGKMAGFMVTIAQKLVEMLPNFKLLSSTPLPTVPGVPPVAPGAVAPGAAAASTAGGAAVAAGVAAPIVIAGGAALTTAMLTPRDYSISAEESAKQVEEANKGLPAGIPKAGDTQARQAIEAAAPVSGAAAWVNSPPIGHGGQAEFAKRYAWLMSQPNALDLLSGGKGNFTPPEGFKVYSDEAFDDGSGNLQRKKFLKGGYTDWGSNSGRIIEAHGGEYIEPKHTVDHYGVDAMRAVHEKRAVIGYSTGGQVPTAFPGNPLVPFLPGIGGGLGSYNPNAPGYVPGGVGMGPWNSPFFKKVPPKRRKSLTPVNSAANKKYGYQVGGMIPMANPNWEMQDPGFSPNRHATQWRGSVEAIWGPNEMPIGTYPWEGKVGGRHGRGPGPVPGFTAPGLPSPGAEPMYPWGGGLMAGQTLWDWLGSHEDGGLVYDPNTGQWVQTGPAQSHLQNPASSGPGVIDTVVSGTTSGLSNVFANVQTAASSGFAGQTASGATGFAGQTASASVTPGMPNVPGSPGYTGPLGPAPGPSTPGTTSTGGLTTGSPFADAFLGALGIPGLANANTGPGWGDQGPPPGLGGQTQEQKDAGEAGFDIRNFGIGPGPPGSGPADWARFTGQTLGTFGASFVTTLASGLLDFVGLSGVSSYIQAGGQIGGHFMPSSDKSSVQGPGAAETNAAVLGDIATLDQMPTNPAYPGAPTLPNVFDPATGAVTPSGPGNGGLQVNTLRGKAIIEKLFPWSLGHIGGVRPDRLKWHPSGLALDVMTDPDHGLNDPPSAAGLQKGNQLYNWLNAHKSELGIDYLMWGPITGDADHYNHIHVNFAASGYPSGSGSPASIDIASPSVGPTSGRTAAPHPGRTAHQHGSGPPAGTTMWPVKSFAFGGFNTAALPIKPLPPGPVPRPPDVITKQVPPPLPAQPKPSVPAISPAVPPPPTGAPPPPGTGGAPVQQAPGPGGGRISLLPGQAQATPDVKDEGDHVHPGLRKGITSGFATAGSLAAMAINAAAAAGSFGAAGAAGAGGGGIGSFVQGLFTQAGKIANNVANVASSFLVGNITGGTTANPYGVTQRGNVPTGGTKVVDGSNNHYGDIYTQDLDQYFTLVDRRNNQKAQSELGRWGSQV